MILKQGEYEISADGKKITITKKCLEEWRNHYRQNAIETETSIHKFMCLGKEEVLIDLLKMFEPLEG